MLSLYNEATLGLKGIMSLQPSIKLSTETSGFIRRFSQEVGLTHSAETLTDYSFAHEYRNLLLDIQISISKKYPQTSCSGPIKAVTPLGDFSYSYQRINLHWHRQEWLKLIHGIHRPDMIQYGSFKRSGMAALESVLDFFVSLGLSIEISAEPYYETLFKLRRGRNAVTYVASDGNSFGNHSDILFLDTSSRIWPELPTQRGNVRFIVLDSACVEASHPLIPKVIDAANAIDAAIIMVRSHMKLDCFGLDVGTLGSIVVLRPTTASSEIVEILDQYREYMSESNYRDDAARLHEIYAWLGHTDFHKISMSAMEETRNHSQQLFAACKNLGLSEKRFKILSYEHKLYFSISLLDSAGDTGNDKKLSLAIAERCQAAGEAVFAGSTFGLSYTSVDDFNNSNDFGRRHVRICASQTEHDAETVANSIAAVLTAI